MKSFLSFLTVSFLTSLLLFSCKNDVEVIERNYAAPTISTQNALIAGDDTFILKAEITVLNDIEVIEHGFVIQKRIGSTTYEREQTIIIKEKAEIGNISLTHKPTVKLRDGDYYRYYYYLKTKLGFYKGQQQIITINDISLPHLNTTATLGETISLEGDFSKINSDYILVTEGLEASTPYTVSADKKKLEFKMSNVKNAYHGNLVNYILKSKIDPLEVTPRRIATVKILGKLDPPKKLSYKIKDQLVFTGEALPNDNNSDFIILINNVEIPYKQVIQITEILGFTTNTFKLGYKNGRDIVHFPDEIVVDRPIGNQIVFNKKIIHPRSSFSISGYEFEYIKSEYHYLGTYSIIPNNVYGDQYTFRIADFPDGHYSYKYVSDYYEVETPTTIEVRSLKVNKPTLNQYYIGAEIHLTGNFIKDETYYINLNEGDLMQTFRCEVDGKLKVENVANKKGNFKFGVGYEGIGGIYFPYSFDITSLGHTIEDFTPKKGYQGQLITITGKGVHLASSVHVGDLSINYNIQRGQDVIKFIIPNTFYKGRTTIGVTMHNDYYQFDEKFEIL